MNQLAVASKPDLNRPQDPHEQLRLLRKGCIISELFRNKVETELTKLSDGLALRERSVKLKEEISGYLTIKELQEMNTATSLRAIRTIRSMRTDANASLQKSEKILLESREGRITLRNSIEDMKYAYSVIEALVESDGSFIEVVQPNFTKGNLQKAKAFTTDLRTLLSSGRKLPFEEFKEKIKEIRASLEENIELFQQLYFTAEKNLEHIARHGIPLGFKETIEAEKIVEIERHEEEDLHDLSSQSITEERCVAFDLVADYIDPDFHDAVNEKLKGIDGEAVFNRAYELEAMLGNEVAKCVIHSGKAILSESAFDQVVDRIDVIKSTLSEVFDSEDEHVLAGIRYFTLTTAGPHLAQWDEARIQEFYEALRSELPKETFDRFNKNDFAAIVSNIASRAELHGLCDIEAKLVKGYIPTKDENQRIREYLRHDLGKDYEQSALALNAVKAAIRFEIRHRNKDMAYENFIKVHFGDLAATYMKFFSRALSQMIHDEEVVSKSGTLPIASSPLRLRGAVSGSDAK